MSNKAKMPNTSEEPMKEIDRRKKHKSQTESERERKEKKEQMNKMNAWFAWRRVFIGRTTERM